MKQVNNFPLNSNMCILHDDKWLKRQRIAGRIAGQTLSLLQRLVEEKTVKSLLELDKIAEEFILANGCTPTFLGYRGFPNSVCMSLDNEKSHALVHGIPFDYELQEGDLISFDLGCTFEGAIGDTAITCIYGKTKSEGHIKLVQDTKDALMVGINAIAVGKKIGVIGNAIYKFLAPKYYGVITSYGGHSLNYNTPHCFPFVANRANINDGITIQPGMTLAIEPLVVLNGSIKTWVGKDGWTVCTEHTSAHEEHTVFIHDDRVEIITEREKSNG
jgi:methionyl aminopeptidase